MQRWAATGSLGQWSNHPRWKLEVAHRDAGLPGLIEPSGQVQRTESADLYKAITVLRNPHLLI